MPDTWPHPDDEPSPQEERQYRQLRENAARVVEIVQAILQRRDSPYAPLAERIRREATSVLNAIDRFKP